MQITPNGHEPIVSPRLNIPTEGKLNLLLDSIHADLLRKTAGHCKK